MGQRASKLEQGIQVERSVLGKLVSLPKGKHTSRSIEVTQTSFIFRNMMLPVFSAVTVRTKTDLHALAIIVSLPYTPDDDTLPKELHVNVMWLVKGTQIPPDVRQKMDPKPYATDVFLVTGEVAEVPLSAIQDVVSWKPYTMHIPKVTNFR